MSCPGEGLQLYLAKEQPMKNCACQRKPSLHGSREALFREFGHLRQDCPVLRELLIPDEIWPDFHGWCLDKPGRAHHRPVTWRAYDRNHLSRITSPIHRFLFLDGRLNPQVTNQYKADLMDRWIARAGEPSRFQAGKGFCARLSEVKVAEYLENQAGFKVTGMEAIGANYDIEATARDGRDWTIEVKHIDEEKGLFKAVWLSDQPKLIPITGMRKYGENYFLFRVLEAVKQLEDSQKRRAVAMVWADGMGVPSRIREFDWKNPKFPAFSLDEWRQVFGEDFKVKQDLQVLVQDPKAAVRQLDRLWVSELKEWNLQEVARVDF